MKLSKETLRKVAHLARLEVSPQQEDRLLKELEKSIGWLKKLSEVDIAGIKPLKNMSFEVNMMRQDKTNKEISKEELLKNAPCHDGDYIKVPQIMNPTD